MESLAGQTRCHDWAMDEVGSVHHCFHLVNAALGKQLMIIGGTLLAVGAILCWWRPLRGGLPGDIVIQRPGFSFYFPVVTSLVLSLVLNWVLRWLNR